jgi:hypothetical protein
MAIFSKSLKQLLQEKAELEAILDAKWAALAQEGPISVEAATTSFRAEHLALVALKNRIREKTPRTELVARRDELRRILGSGPPTDAESAMLRAELITLDLHLEAPYRKQVTLRDVAIVFGIPALVLAVKYFLEH